MIASRVIVDGRLTELADPRVAVQVRDAVIRAPDGGCLVAVSHDGLCVRWIDPSEVERIVSEYLKPHAPKQVKATRQACPWIYTVAEAEFDVLAAERQEELRTAHEAWRVSSRDHGKRPETYRRWLRRVKRGWVKNVVSGAPSLSLTSPSHENHQDD